MTGSPRRSVSGFDVPSLSSKSANVSSRRRKSTRNKLPPTNPIHCTAKRASIQTSTPSKPPCINDSHFLQGINFENCQDLLSIPDPPTPQSNHRSDKKSHRRRQSSPLVAIPLRNMTNEQEPPSRDSVVAKKKSRKSLCHVPSPVLSESKHEVQPDSILKRPQSTTVVHQPTSPPTTLRVHEGWGGEDEDFSRSRKRSRRRQSLVLPSEMESSEQPTNFPVQESLAPTASSSAVKANHFASLQAMIREYCSLPESLRTSSGQSQLIQRQTGYKLDFPVATSRREVLNRLGPSIADMDKRKLQDTNRLEQVTGCRVHKSRNGKYRYISLQTNSKVAPEDYQGRYMQYVETEKTEKAKTYIKEIERLEVSLPDVDQQASHPDRESLSRQVEESTDGGALQQTEEQPESEAILPLPIERVSPATTNSQDQELSPCSAPEDDPEMPRTCLDLQEQQGNSPTSQQPQPVLPLPSREEESNDPEIALAEQELWRAIDGALEVYSLKVMSIREARKNGIEYKP